MSLSNVFEIISTVKHDFVKECGEIVDALDIFNLAFDDLLNSINNKINTLNKMKDYDKSIDLINVSKEIAKLQLHINEYAAILNVETELEEEECSEDLEIIDEEKDLPNYDEYKVDSSVPHNLFEDFTHKKTAAFSINGARYEAHDWKDVLLKTCDILSEIDADKFYSFIDDPVMQGRKVSYFGRNFIEKRNSKLKNIDIYVWTNLSANSVKKLVRKLLRKFSINIHEFFIYLRADYTPLHAEVKSRQGDDSVNDCNKIGKFVRLSIRQLSNKHQIFSDKEIIDMQSDKWSNDVLGLNYPLFKRCIDGVDISKQIRDGAYGRYWKEIFEFNGVKFLITSQWYERNRDAFTKWLANYI